MTLLVYRSEDMPRNSRGADRDAAVRAKRIAGDRREVYISFFFPGISASDPSNCSALAEIHLEVKHERRDYWGCGEKSDRLVDCD